MKYLILALLFTGNLFAERFEKDGIVVEFSVDVDKPVAGQDLKFRFAISDTTSGSSIDGAYPAAWIDPTSKAEPVNRKIERFIQGGLFGQAELDLNIYYVITLNHDATLSVVDPRFGVGSTKLLALVPLPGNGSDWVLSRDEGKLFASVPQQNQIVVVDTLLWKITSTIEAKATRLALQADGHYLWASDGDSKMTVIDAESYRIKAQIPIGKGTHATAFSDNDRLALIACGRSVTEVDVHTLKVVRSYSIGSDVASLAYSSLAQALYVCGDGVAVLADGEIAKRIPCGPGLAQIRFAPGGRYAFALSPDSDRVHIIDASSNQLIQSGDTRKHPAQIAFSDEIAYISHRDTAEISAIPLAQIGRSREFSVAEVSGGQKSPGNPTVAARIVQAPGASAVLIANPGDHAVYFYKEGMAAPMGSFQNYSRQPLAVNVIDRSLRERKSPGVYETVGRLSKPGTYDVCFFLDAPRMIHGFKLTIAENPDATKAAISLRPKVALQTLKFGTKAEVAFQMSHCDQFPDTIPVLVYLAPGNWNKRATAAHRGDGLYSLELDPQRAGTYYVNVTGFGTTKPAILNFVAK